MVEEAEVEGEGGSRGGGGGNRFGSQGRGGGDGGNKSVGGGTYIVDEDEGDLDINEEPLPKTKIRTKRFLLKILEEWIFITNFVKQNLEFGFVFQKKDKEANVRYIKVNQLKY